jgi:hypothetical protein
MLRHDYGGPIGERVKLSERGPPSPRARNHLLLRHTLECHCAVAEWSAAFGRFTARKTEASKQANPAEFFTVKRPKGRAPLRSDARLNTWKFG